MRRISTASAAGILVALMAAFASAPVQGEEAASARATRTCEGLEPTIVGKKGDDKELKGTRRDDVILARGGDDLVDGRGGDDIICAGSGQDFVGGGGGDDLVNGDPGNDILLGNGGKDDLFGKRGDDGISGGESGGDLCHGGPGEDLAVKDDCERIQSAKGV